MRIWVPLELDNPKVKFEGVVPVPEVIHNILRHLDTVPARCAHGRVVDLDFGFGGMVQGDLLLIPSCLLRNPKVLGHDPRSTGLIVAL